MHERRNTNDFLKDNPKMKDLFNHFSFTKKYEYEFTVLEDKHVEQATQVVNRAFCKEELMLKYLNVTEDEFLVFTAEVVQKAAKEGLSVVGLHNGKVVACVIQEDVADPITLESKISPKLEIVFSFLDDLRKDYFEGNNFDKKRMIHLFMTAIDPNYMSKGLAKMVNYEAMKLSYQKGFAFVTGEQTHPLNGGITRYPEKSYVPARAQYKDYVYQGTKPFAKLENEAKLFIMSIRPWEGQEAEFEAEKNINDTHLPKAKL